MPGSIRDRAASTRTSVSCTRSSAAGWLPTRDRTIRRTIGSRAEISPADPESPAASSEDTALTYRTVTTFAAARSPGGEPSAQPRAHVGQPAPELSEPVAEPLRTTVMAGLAELPEHRRAGAAAFRPS